MNTALLSSIQGTGSTPYSYNLLVGNTKAQETERKFSALVDGIKAGMDESIEQTKNNSMNVTAESLMDPRLPGDYISSFHIENPTEYEKNALVQGAAANAGIQGRVDRTSKLYEQSLELESYFVKILLSSMRNTVQKSSLTGENDFASKMYEDMLYDELARDMTKNAGFGLADQIYLELTKENL